MQAKTFDIKMVKLVLRCTAQKKVAKIPDLSISNSISGLFRNAFCNLEFEVPSKKKS